MYAQRPSQNWVKPPNKKKSDAHAIKDPSDAEAKARAPTWYPADMTDPATHLALERLASLGSRRLDQGEPAPKQRRTVRLPPTKLAPQHTRPMLPLTDADPHCVPSVWSTQE